MAKDRIIFAFLYLFYTVLSKSLRKAYFLRVKLGSLERKLPRLGIDIFLNFLTLKTFYSNKPLKKARTFSSLVILMRVKNGGDCVGGKSDSVYVIRRHCTAQGLLSNCVCTETCHTL